MALFAHLLSMFGIADSLEADDTIDSVAFLPLSSVLLGFEMNRKKTVKFVVPNQTDEKSTE